jgi:ubiquinone/menaquinone biosynthesis C-methylase UbiE
MHHKRVDDPKTTGRVIHAARWYDMFGRVISLGRDTAIRETFVELSAPVPGENVLDVGCGTATLAIAMKSRVDTGEVHGIDASPEMIEVAKRKIAEKRVDVDLRVALVEEIPFPEESFDLVTSSLMLHHLPEDLKRTGLAEIRRVLKRKGRFVAMDFAVESHGVRGHLLSLFGHAPGKRLVEKLPPMLRDAGFTRVESVASRYRTFDFIRAS